ncbi:unnamed protein product [Polarella glacialis]|uniref:Uncharacterized protein n=1 Tax=Polarella glacialis TaxID=89957 RepID=A0A813JML0_POLGL|nr:unnamed protein product [Polarella glacialis]
MYDRNPVQWLIGLMVTEAIMSSSALLTEPTVLCTGYCRGAMYCPTMICPAGYEMECQSISCDERASGKPCGGEGYVTSYVSCDGGENHQAMGCCICNETSPLGPTVAPTETGRSCQDGMLTLPCPAGYTLSQPHSFCSHHSCSVLGPNYVAELMNYGYGKYECACSYMGDIGYGHRCRACEPGPDSTGSSSTTLSIMLSTSTTTTSSMDIQAYMCALEAIERRHWCG